MKSLNFTIFLTLFALLFSCKQKENNNESQTNDKPLFNLLSASETGIDFANMVKEDTTFNILNYLYFYNGGGVSIGDINNDSLPDIYLTANRLPNKLYLNKGNFKFEDITEKAGVAGQIGWTTGTSMADVNGDGWLDIYVCNVSGLLGLNAHNQLFINNQNGTFSEKSKEYGLDFSGFATQAAFFDYDNDGDLDCYLLNHSTHYEGTLKRADEIRPEKNDRAGDRLMRNDLISPSRGDGRGAIFTDVTSQSGIYSSAVGYGLGISIGDLNQDGWQDIYIANDFHENDYVYLNNGNGTFTENIKQIAGHTSKFSMGVDMADFNNDGRLDVFSADMMPENEQIRKESEESSDAYSIYLFKNTFGYHHQFAKNALQLNVPLNKNANKINFQFAEIAQLAGVATTDWSWSVLFADLDNDGWKDLFVANGIPHRPNDMDYLKFVSEPEIKGGLQMGLDEAKLKYVEKMPVIKIGNYAFKNNKDLTFSNVSKNWGLDKAGFSNGTAYADLDNDGDLDLVVNNINDPVAIYKNESEKFEKNNYLKIKFLGNDKNTSGIGAKVALKLKNKLIYQEQSPTRGFQSSSDPILTIGLGESQIIDTLMVTWLSGKTQLLINLKSNQLLTLKQSEADKSYLIFENFIKFPTSKTQFQDITNQVNIPFKHEENAISDFEREFLIPYALSTQGSKIAKGDINNDGLEDIFIPNGKWKTSALLIQQKNSSFQKAQQAVFEPDSICEDVSAAFFDADNDKDLDLIVVSAGNEFFGNAKEIQPRLYLNDGKGNLTKTNNAIPEIFLNASCVKPADFDGDGDTDLFIGARIETRKFGTDPQSYLLENLTISLSKGAQTVSANNDSKKGIFRDISAQALPKSALGMVTDAVWADFNNDKQLDLVVVGEWMPITFLENQKGKFMPATNSQTSNSEGFWNSIIAEDFDGDGDTDFVAGNWGQNSYLKPTEKEPITLYVKDFDANGSPDPIICTFRTNSEGKRVSYPLPSKDEMTSQLPHLRKKFLKYKDYSKATIEDIFPADSLKNALVKYAYNFNTSYIENQGNRKMELRALPIEAQFSVVSALQSGDFDGDGKKDILLAGNFYGVTPLLSRYDASMGLLLKGDGKGNFSAISPAQSGFVTKGECRDIQLVTLANGKTIVLVMRNNEALQVLEFLKPKLLAQ